MFADNHYNAAVIMLAALSLQPVQHHLSKLIASQSVFCAWTAHLNRRPRYMRIQTISAEAALECLKHDAREKYGQ